MRRGADARREKGEMGVGLPISVVYQRIGFMETWLRVVPQRMRSAALFAESMKDDIAGRKRMEMGMRGEEKRGEGKKGKKGGNGEEGKENKKRWSKVGTPVGGEWSGGRERARGKGQNFPRSRDPGLFHFFIFLFSSPRSPPSDIFG